MLVKVSELEDEQIMNFPNDVLVIHKRNEQKNSHEKAAKPLNARR